MRLLCLFFFQLCYSPMLQTMSDYALEIFQLCFGHIPLSSLFYNTPLSAGIGDFSLSRSETTALELFERLGPALLSVVSSSSCSTSRNAAVAGSHFQWNYEQVPCSSILASFRTWRLFALLPEIPTSDGRQRYVPATNY